LGFVIELVIPELGVPDWRHGISCQELKPATLSAKSH
jgi:hypothetical protein